jgi:hypothetical protein
MMEIEFDLSEADILALTRQRHKTIPALKKRFERLRFGYLLAFSLIGAGLLLTGDKFLGVAFIILAAALFLAFPFYYDWRIASNVRLAYRDDKQRATLCKRVLPATGDGLEEISPFAESKVRWAVIDDITVTATHAFISIGQSPCMVIPKAKVPETFDLFIQTCRHYQQTGKGL